MSPNQLVIRVVILPGDNSPYCSIPDAGNETRCEFYKGWLDNGAMTTLDDSGWRTITAPSARAACSAAMFSLGQLVDYYDVNTCAYLLLYIRFRDLPPDERNPEDT